MYCAFTPNCLQVGSDSWLRTYLTNQYVILRHCSPNLCKQNYLYSNLPFYKIQANHLMARDESSGAKIIPKCILWVRGLVPFWVLNIPFFLWQTASDYITSSWRLAGEYSFCPLLMPMSKLSLSPLYFNKTLLHKSSEWSIKMLRETVQIEVGDFEPIFVLKF